MKPPGTIDMRPTSNMPRLTGARLTSCRRLTDNMAVVINLIKEYAPWIYGACALVALWYLRVAFSARRERRYAVFSLEREAAMNRTYGGWTVAIALLVVMGLVYLTSTVVLEAVRPLAGEIMTPTPIVVTPSRPTPTLPVPEATPTDVPTARPRPTLRPQPTVAAAPPPSRRRRRLCRGRAAPMRGRQSHLQV